MIYKSQHVVPSSSGRRNTLYVVSERPDGSWECSCMSWTRTTPRQDCKHILMIRLKLLEPVSKPSAILEQAVGRKFR